MEPFPHRLRRPGRTTTPQHAVVVCAVPCLHPGLPGEGRWTAELDTWHGRYRRWRSPDRWTDHAASGRTAADWWRWLDSCLDRRRPLWVWTVGGYQTYTLLGLWERLEVGAYRWRRLVDSPEVFSCRLDTPRGPAELVDARNWYRGPWAPPPWCSGHDGPSAWGESVPPVARATWAAERTADLMGLVSSIHALVLKGALGPLARTAAGQALSACRRLVEAPGPCVHARADVAALERAAFFSGRNEVFRRGPFNGHLTYLDVQSSYPHCLGSYPYPVRHQYTLECPSLLAVESLLRDRGVIAAVKLSTPEHVFPKRDSHGLLFPLGDYQTALAGPELSAAMRTGVVRRVLAAAVYEMGSPFSGVVETLTRLRDLPVARDDPRVDEIVKMLAVSLVGKLGARSPVWRDVPDTPPARRRWGYWYKVDGESKLQMLRSVAGRCQQLCRPAEGLHSCVFVPAYCAAYARELLRTYLDACPLRSCLYCDTDSLYVTDRGLKALSAAGHVRPGQPGLLRAKGEADQADFVLPKAYTFGAIRHVAGVPAVSPRQPDGSYRVVRAPHLSLAPNVVPGPDCDLTEAIVDVRGPYLLRAEGPDGWTRPLVLPAESLPAPRPDRESLFEEAAGKLDLGVDESV